MSLRARHARRLASLLTARTGAYVLVRYDRTAGRYQVQWSGGPDRESMRELATEYAEEVAELDVAELVWLRSSG
ncbi:hypothetical protein N8J89_20975 [Crossiella sp. CA-258035]|uniref:hypothetical protein n=1 Tax=Crossiella sp. CA-258035 TaxID=2981138 RepID=UPI0024BC6510|nr:hypothetical protein [Crossiella sp. CA-258035]WHT15622.1 hypothetical protein N8J89_20975 [Crossiella sp. CA-258035]